MARDGITIKQDRFARNLFLGMSEREAYVQAGYSSKQLPATLDRNACELAKSSKVVARREELVKQAVDASVMTVLERKRRLSELGKASLVDFMGEDGEPVLSRDVPNNSAASEYSVRTRSTKDGDTIKERTLKLRDPIAAIAELNKMDGLYKDNDRSAEVVVSNFVFILPDGTRLKPGQLTGEVRRGGIIDQPGTLLPG
jgi:phage terminase small subunit